MANRDQIETFMRNFPSQSQILTMEPEDLGAHMLQYMMRGQAETNRFNFMQMVFPGQIAERFMEAWSWLEREGFIAHKPNDINGHGFFVTRAGQRVAKATDFDAWKQESVFPDGLDPIIMSKVKPEFARGEYEMVVFRSFKEIEMRVRDKDSSLSGESGVDLMNKAFGPNGPLMRGADKKERAAMRELLTGAFSIFRNPSAHREVKFDEPREVVDMICFANQLLRMVGRL
jgi:uncharacterized protein (TIGR02391 family)